MKKPLNIKQKEKILVLLLLFLLVTRKNNFIIVGVLEVRKQEIVLEHSTTGSAQQTSLAFHF